MNQDIFQKYLKNQCSQVELEEVIRWAKQDTHDLKNKKQLEDIWLNSVELEDIQDEKLSQLFDKIMLKVNSEESKEQKELKGGSPVKDIFTWVTRVAAILLLPVLLFLFYTLSEKDQLSHEFAALSVDSLEIEAPFGSRTRFQLSDGTKVHLNYGSKLKYPLVFVGETREVTLSGEGYFDVAYNPDMPFIVKTGDLNVKVLGTAFNVFAYPTENYIETTLVHGKVNLERGDQMKPLCEMVPGQHTRYCKIDGTTVSTYGGVDKYISWKDGKFIFEDTPITEVADRLSKMFNVDIQVSNDIKDFNYTVTIIDEPLFQILDLMIIAAPVKYSVLPRVRKADGTFSRQKIILEKRK
ncbi:MAG: FecR domain-containing protein [Bacteroidales bacterium]|nr:FecR domain-containing protein [Bacteroidales bacterium]